MNIDKTSKVQVLSTNHIKHETSIVKTVSP